MSSSPVNRINFIYQLEGALREIDIFELAPALLSMGELIQEGNRTLNPDGPRLAVNVRPFREGSFEVDIVLFAQTHLPSMFASLGPDSPQKIIDLLKAIGVIKGFATSALEALKKLRGRKPKRVEQIKPGEVTYISEDDVSITVNGPVHQLIQKPTIVQNIYKVYKPLERTEVEKIKSYLKDDEEGTQIEITKEDGRILKEYGSVSALLPGTEVEMQNTTQVFLNPKRGSFDGDGTNWSFKRGDAVITATIKDLDFLERCKRAEIRLHHSDLLTVELLEKQKAEGTKVKSSYDIIKVLDYRRGSEQQSLDFSSPSPPDEESKKT